MRIKEDDSCAIQKSSSSCSIVCFKMILQIVQFNLMEIVFLYPQCKISLEGSVK